MKVFAAIDEVCCMFQTAAAGELICIALGLSGKFGRPAERGASHCVACGIVKRKCLRVICLGSLQPQQGQEHQDEWSNHAL